MSGSNVTEIAGTYAIKRVTINMKKTKGIARYAIFRIDSHVNPETTNKFKPNGGVINPTPNAVIIMTQN